MNLAEMRTDFKRKTAGLAVDLADGEIDTYLNRFYRYMVPNDVGGEYAEGVWGLVCAPLEDVYPYPSIVFAPKATSAWIQSQLGGADLSHKHFLNVETDVTTFESRDRDYPVSTTGALPQHILFYERNVTLSPTPDKLYIINIPSRMGPVLPLQVVGLADESHAKAVVSGAAWEFLSDEEDQEGMSVQADAYEYYKSKLVTNAQARPNHRRPIRSFK